MGLDTTHNAWHGSYSSFNKFRSWLGEQIGINLKDYIGYGNDVGLELSSIDHDLQPLFDHSDCDGELTPEQCKQIADGIDSVLKTAPKDDFPYSHYQSAVEFRDGCLLAYSKNESMEFY